MLIEIYVFYSLLAVFLFLYSFTAREISLLVQLISFVLFILLAFSSGNIEKKYCEYSTTWQCRTEFESDFSLMALNSGMGMLAFVYAIANIMGKLEFGERKGVMSSA